MILKTTEEQAKRVHQLVRDQCANCIDRNCLLLDDGESHQCVQLISIYGIYCKYFRETVLPVDKKLYNQIIQYNKSKERKKKK